MVTKELYWNYFTGDSKDTILQILNRMGWNYDYKTPYLLIINIPIEDIDLFDFIFDNYL